jgi:hypothetical protein
MDIEQGNSANEISKQSERLLPGHKLLLADPASLLAFSLAKKSPSEKMFKLDERLMLSIFAEWHSIYNLFVNLVGKDNIVVSKTDITVGKHNKDSSIDRKSFDLPEKLSFGAIGIPFLSKFYLSWPRDAYIALADKIFANPKAWNMPSKDIEISELGEQGKVLTKNKAILVTPDVWKKSRHQISELTQDGFDVGCLLNVDKCKQNYRFEESHIDGHSALIEDKNGDLVLLVADSYSHQGNGARKLIKQAADTVGARMIEIDDRNLPPLALNLIQFEDGSIAFTNSEAKDLEITLAELVGNNKLFKTKIPLIAVPRLSSGGMRCLTNILPPALNTLL